MAKPVGAVVIGMGLATLVCALVGGIWDSLDPLDATYPGGLYALVGSAVAMILPGGFLYHYGHGHQTKTMSRREAVLAVAIIWLSAGSFGALPFVFGAGLSPADAFFESVSGFSTTGSTVITDLDERLSRSMHLFRSLIQWLGGAGIVVLFVAVFPNVGAGGKHLYKGEVSGVTTEGLKPRIRETSLAIWKLYVTFTVIVGVVLALLGMSPFDAVCHALTVVATAGFSTRDASIAAFQNPAVEYFLAVVMLVSSVNFGLYYAAFGQRKLRVLRKNIELRIFLWMTLCFWIAVAMMNYPLHGDVEATIRKSFFMVASTVSTTGYALEDYTAWSHTALGLFLFMMFVGGCSSSTAGGLKVERLILLFQIALTQVKKSFRPSAVQLVRLGKTIINDQLLADVAAIFIIYVATIFVGTLVVTLTDGVPLTTAFGATLSCASNAGPSPFFLGGDHFADYSSFSKVLFALIMILGRLEFFTVLALFVPSFWRR
ncbi:MAG: TrkH family potassium uptake protein [Myxococcales bacterium]|nr:TrkH family potassium uptake protein [Myxococcales bacterium]